MFKYDKFKIGTQLILKLQCIVKYKCDITHNSAPISFVYIFLHLEFSQEEFVKVVIIAHMKRTTRERKHQPRPKSDLYK